MDWAITMPSYSGLHWIDGYLAGKNLDPRNHEIRDDEIERNGSLSAIFKDYRRLKDLSRTVRYEIPNFICSVSRRTKLVGKVRLNAAKWSKPLSELNRRERAVR